MKIHLPEVCLLTISDSGILIAIFKTKFQLVSGSFGTPVIIYSDTFVFRQENKNPDSIWNRDFSVVPPGIVIYFQVVEYHSFLKATQR